MSQERQLLFGVFAVQTGLVTAQAVLAAAGAWAVDRTESLAERLEAAGDLSAEQRALIEQLVRTAVAAHGGDESLTLESVQSPSPQAQSLVNSIVLCADPPGATATDTQAAGSPAAEDLLAVTAEHPGRYQTQSAQEIGRGGIGRVMLVTDRHLGREVAVKELLPGRCGPGLLAADGSVPAPVARFLREARVTGQLEHPNIVPVYELGQRADGSLYYTMKIVRGQTLARAFADARDLGERLRLLPHLVDLCQAVAYAHSRGVVHRDIKPENVMLGEFGETVVLDWGLAKTRGFADARGEDLERQVRELRLGTPSQTVDGATMGTPSYMSPEQADGQIDAIDERSDVWALGAVLFELLTGRPPFLGDSPVEILGRLLRGEIPRVSDSCPEAPAELVAIVDKALKRDKRDRYASARALAREVSAYMTGRRVSAYDYSSFDLLKRFAARNKTVVGTSLVLLVVIVVSLGLVLLALSDERAALVREQKALGVVQTERLRAAYNLAMAYFQQAEWLMRQRRRLAARVYAAASLAANPAQPDSLHHDPTYAERSAEARWLAVEAASLCIGQQTEVDLSLLTRFNMTGEVHGLVFLPGGEQLAATDLSGTLIVWDLDQGREAWRVAAHDAGAVPLLRLSSGQELLTGGEEGGLKVWRVGQPQPVQSWRFSAPVVSLAASRAGAWIAVGGKDKRVRILERQTGAVRTLPQEYGDEVHGLAFSPDDKILAVASWDGTARLIDWRRGKEMHGLKANEESLTAVAFSPSGEQLVTSGFDGRARIWDVATGHLVREMVADVNTARAAAFSPRTGYLVTAASDEAVRLWDPASGQLLVAADGSDRDVYAVAVSDDGTRIGSGSNDKTISVWRVEQPEGALQVQASDWIYGLAVDPTGRALVLGTWDKRVVVRDARTLAPIATTGLAAPAYSAAFDPDGGRLALGLRGGAIVLWRPAANAPPRALGAHDDDVLDLAFNPDGTRLYSTSTDGQLRCWDVASGRVLARATGFGDRAWSLDLSPDGTSIAAIGDNGTVLVFESEGLRQVSAMDSGRKGGTDVRWSRDGRLLYSACGSAEVLVSDPKTGRLLRSLKGNKRWVHVLGLSPDGRFLASAGLGGKVVIWDTASEDPVQIIHLEHSVENMAFDSGGDRLWIVAKNQLLSRRVADVIRGIDVQATLDRSLQRAGLRLEQLDLLGAKSEADEETAQ